MRRNKILVCIDFQKQSIAALQQCYDIARFIKAEIVLLYVIESSDKFSKIFSSNVKKAKDEARAHLEEVVKTKCKDSDIKYSFEVEIGKVPQEIIKKAHEIKARFILMGKNGSDQGIKKFIGSNTSKVISESDYPVISVKGSHSIGYKNIVLPLDLTKSTREKVASAISFSRFFNSHIHIVTVHSVGIIYQATSLYNRIKKIERTLRNNGVVCTHRFYRRDKRPDHEHVLNYSKEVNADLIMIMTHQEGRVRDYYIGAFAHHVINESDIPVLSLTPSVPEETEKNVVESFVDPFNMF